MKWAVSFGALALTGCAIFQDVVAEDFVTPDGKQAHIVYCGGGLSSMGECYTDARKLCGGDYTLIKENITPRGETSTENRSIQIMCGR